MRKVLGIPGFGRLLAAWILTELGTSISAVALAVLVYRRTGSALGATAFFLCAEFGPAFVSPVLVSRLDQRSARRVLATLYLLVGLAFGVLASLLFHLSVPAVLLLALVIGSLGVTTRVLSRAAWTPAATSAGLLREANAAVNSAASVSFLIGPAVGGGLVALGGTRLALLVNVAAFALCALIVATAQGLPPAVAERDPAAGRLRAAFAYVRRHRAIRRLLYLQAGAMLFFTISIPIEVVLAERTLRSGAGGYGLLLSAWGGGAIAGSALYARWRARSLRGLITVGTLLLATGFLLMAIAPNIGLAIGGAAIGGVGNGIQIVAMRTALQEATSARWMSLILSVNESMFQAVPGVGIALGGALTAIAGARIGLATAAVGSFGIAIAMWVGLRQVDEPGLTAQRELAAAEQAEPHLTVATRHR